MSLIVRFIIIVTIVVAITDTVVFYAILQHPENLTVPFLISVIIITVIPIAINLWYWLVLKQGNVTRKKEIAILAISVIAVMVIVGIAKQFSWVLAALIAGIGVGVAVVYVHNKNRGIRNYKEGSSSSSNNHRLQ